MEEEQLAAILAALIEKGPASAGVSISIASEVIPTSQAVAMLSCALGVRMGIALMETPDAERLIDTALGETRNMALAVIGRE